VSKISFVFKKKKVGKRKFKEIKGNVGKFSYNKSHSENHRCLFNVRVHSSNSFLPPKKSVLFPEAIVVGLCMYVEKKKRKL